jgi:hypothetical protein
MRDDELRERFRALADTVGSQADQPPAARIRWRGRRARRLATGGALAVVIALTFGGTLLTRALVLSTPQALDRGEVPPPPPTTATGPASTPTSTTRRPPDTSRSPATTTTAAPTTTSARTTTTTQRAPAPCRARELSAENRGIGGAAGSLGLTVAMRNTGGSSCTLGGAPAVLLLRDGEPLPTHAQPDGAVPPAGVTIRPGREVTFYILWANPSMEEEDLSTCQPESTHVRLTPPNQTGTLTLRAAVNTCHGNIRVTAPQA